MKDGPKSSLRPFLHRDLQVLKQLLELWVSSTGLQLINKLNIS